MNAKTEKINSQRSALGGAVQSGDIEFIDAMSQYTKLTNELWWAELGEDLDNVKQGITNKLEASKDWTVDKAKKFGAWFDENIIEPIKQLAADFQALLDKGVDKFKEAMEWAGQKMSELGSQIVDKFNSFCDKAQIKLHDIAVDAKTMIQNIGTKIYYGAANLGVEVQKGVLAMDDAFQSAKGTVSQAISDKFQANAGKLIVEAHELTEKMERIGSMDLSDQFGGDDKSMREAQAYKDEMVAKLKQEQAKLTEKIQSRESWRDTFKGMKDKADKDILRNANKMSGLRYESAQNRGDKNKALDKRSKLADKSKSSYADKVREARTSANQSRGGRI
ncbi:hypothetical protein [Rickettsiales endosymbiont of Trichoplax sp. H2]|uniref:hypothetical protein n=1 Tax=Rickettsiales endosymbiont of Trichoplax sp. H2 TaxID=2021221 RepID=UPI0012B3BDF9|nr:hypothetical protein [Rickettsiales endosymbiont of Trichoplax sp. H2]MSO13885.1 hypothetical protein [Rickettsiales endosymbiont of Trichoplax sp. H2]